MALGQEHDKEHSMRKQEHIRCGCRSCRAGASTKGGQYVHRQTNRKIRHRTKVALRIAEDFVPITISTPYTD